MEDSMAILKACKDVEFQDVFYTVVERKNIVQKVGKRSLLNGVSGLFRNGQLSGIMGPSGAGKSSLLNALSGYRTSGVTGHILTNKQNSCYITQEDHHQALLTVWELMHFACALKLKSTKSYAEIITDILNNLNLNHRRGTTADNLSGGERKRLSIALELVANPTIFFLDEPTSGLDEVTAGQCIRLLKSLAQQGKTVICTIHQPSTTTLSLFDEIFVLAKGNCVYQGAPMGIVPFLSNASITCPKHYSPSDYIIELCDAEEGSLIPTLTDIIQNGRLLYTEQPCKGNYSQNQGSIESQNDFEFKNAVISMIPEITRTHFSFSCLGGAGIFERMKAISRRMKGDHTSISPFRQFSVLVRLMMLKTFRNKIGLWIQFFHHLMCGIMFGLIFYKSANKGERMFDHLKYCIGSILIIVYTQVMIPILSFPFEVKLVKKQFFNRWYSLTPYYLALTVSRIPLQVFFNIIFLSCSYWMSGLPPEWWRFLLVVLVGLVTSFVAEGMGLAIGATFSVTNGSAVGPLLIAPLMGLAIYGFDFAAEISTIMYAIMKFSYIRVGVVALVLAVFGFNRAELDCIDIYCHFGDPRVLLRYLQIDKVSIWAEFGFLILLMVFFRVLLFISLKRKCKT